MNTVKRLMQWFPFAPGSSNAHVQDTHEDQLQLQPVYIDGDAARRHQALKRAAANEASNRFLWRDCQ